MMRASAFISLSVPALRSPSAGAPPVTGARCRVPAPLVAASGSPFIGSLPTLKTCLGHRKKQRDASRSGVRGARMLVDPWSVSPETLDVVAAQFFAISLFPYIAFLYFLAKPECKTPSLALFGFRFLLVFVFATIPAGIYAKVEYQEILANVDWLHGTAESLLTVTNLLIAIGLRNALEGNVRSSEETSATSKVVPDGKVNTPVVATVAAFTMTLALSGFGLHPEPWNALSFPTWVIHVSSLIEWLVAMGLVWKFASVSGNEKWKGLTWGMIPLHTSGICACTYHLFYNAPSLNLLVALQAALTCVGNGTMAFAAYRIWNAGSTTLNSESASSTSDPSAAKNAPLVGFEDLGEALEKDSVWTFVGKLFLLSAIGSAVVKWGSLYVDGVFDPSPLAALSLIFIPTGLNVAKWAVRSRSPDSKFGSYF